MVFSTKHAYKLFYFQAHLEAKQTLSKGSSINDVTQFWTIFDPSSYSLVFYYYIIRTYDTKS